MFVLQNKETGEVINPRIDDFSLSPSDIIEGAESWDDVFEADLEVDVVEGFLVIDAAEAESVDNAIWAACAGRKSPVELYWDTQCPGSHGVAYRYLDGSQSGACELLRWSDNSQNEDDLNVSDFFDGDGAYTGPNSRGVYPVFLS